MNIVLFVHPSFLAHQSMPRFANMIRSGMLERGHQVEVWTSEPRLFRLGFNGITRKWLGYGDQFILFPKEVKRRLKSVPHDTLFVFTDHALGPWIPLLHDRPHAIHCHDFLAQSSALDTVSENKVGWTGKLYQNMIRKGYSKGHNFISVSEHTRSDLHRFLNHKPHVSEVVYNGLNQPYAPMPVAQARQAIGTRLGLNLMGGYIVHVGGNMWYKNRKGVIDIYEGFRRSSRLPLPLLLIGEKPDETLLSHQRSREFNHDIHWISGLADDAMNAAYAGATLLLFPSLGEGFGWPIAEAMACGCPVVTTDEAPMNEVAGSAGLLIPRMPSGDNIAWAEQAATVVERIVKLSEHERQEVIDAGIKNALRFDTARALDKIESIYVSILKNHIAKT